MGSVSQIYRVIKKDQWNAVKDFRADTRLKDNYLQWMYVNGFVLITTMMFRLDLGKVVDDAVATLRELGIVSPSDRVTLHK